MRDLELMVDGDRDGLVEDGLLLERLPLKHLPALIDPHLRGVADLRAVGEIAPGVVPFAREQVNQPRIASEAGGGVSGDPLRGDPGIHRPRPQGRGVTSSLTSESAYLAGSSSRAGPVSHPRRAASRSAFVAQSALD